MKNVIISLLGTERDSRDSHWRPTLSLCGHKDLMIDRLELLFHPRFQDQATQLTEDIKNISPDIEVRHHTINFVDDSAFDFQTVYGELLDFACHYPFDSDNEQYYLHITTGTHVSQICLFLLSETRYLPGKLLQSIPPNSQNKYYQIIDLDLTQYDEIARRFSREHQQGTDFLKDGIKTRNPVFNDMIAEIEKIAIRSKDPILLTGATGSGKSKLAKRIYDLKFQRTQLTGQWISVNCATLRGDSAMSALFGHTKGAFTGAATARVGFLKRSDQGLLFLDEIGELGLDEQAMLLKSIEEKCFTPLGGEIEISSQFQLIAGTNCNLLKQVQQGKFREDLWARINCWSYELPALKQRLEDLEANIDYELERLSQANNTLITFNKLARDYYLVFAKSPTAAWKSNFRDLNSSITRMATLAEGGRITLDVVEKEIKRLSANWGQEQDMPTALLDNPADFDVFDQLQLENVIRICQQSKNAAEAGRKLFNVSRLNKTSKIINDTKRLSDFLDKFGLHFDQVKDVR